MRQPSERQRFLTGAMVLAVVLTAWANPGNLGNLDSARRMRMAHAWWAGTPEVLPAEAPMFGAVGRGGVRKATFGVGQALILFPIDVVVTPVVERLGLPDTTREAAAAFLMQSFVACLLVLAAFSLLLRLGFDHWESGGGTLALLLGSTALHYLQNAQENLLMAALAMGGTALLLKWRQEGEVKALAWAGCLFGYSLLVRLTTLADLGAAALMILLLERGRARRAVPRFALAFGTFAVLERLVQFARFGNWTRTYYSGAADAIQGAGGQAMLLRYPLGKGVAAALWSPKDSIFLFDPLLAVTLALLAIYWTRISAEVRSYAAGALASLAVYVLFYATYQSPTGEVSWGDRYVSTPVLLLALPAVPLMLQLFGRLPVWGWVVVGWAVLLQLASLAVIMAVEVRQSHAGRIGETIGMRFLNMWLIGTERAAGSDLFYDLPAEWRTWNFLPFQMRFRYPELARYALWGWWLLGGLWLAQALRLVVGLRRSREHARGWQPDQ